MQRAPRSLFWTSILPLVLVIELFTCSQLAADTEISGCVGGSTKAYDQFSSTDFSFLDESVNVDSNQHLVLNTGAGAIDKEKIILSSTQDVKVAFLYEGGCYISNFGYFLLSKAIQGGYVTVDASGNPTLNYTRVQNAVDPTKTAYDPSTFKYIFKHIQDDYTSCSDGDDGILDDFSKNNQLTNNVTSWIAAHPGKTAEDYVAQYDDGTGLPFSVDHDGALTGKDMVKDLGLIAENEEIVFFLVSNGDYNQIFFNKTVFNPDTYNGGCNYTYPPYDKIYHLGQPLTNEGSCQKDKNWLPQKAFSRLSSQFGITLSPTDTYTMQIHTGQKFSHLIVGAPSNDPTQWVLGWEDLFGGGDTDHNDMVFKIQRKTAGRAVSSTLSQTLAASSYITAVNFEVTDHAINCVSGAMGAISASLNNFTPTEWPENTTACQPQQGQGNDGLCPRCGSGVYSGTLNLASPVSVSGDINDDFTRADLSVQQPAVLNSVLYNSCYKPVRDNNGHINCVATNPTFTSVPITVSISGQNLSVDSSGRFSGTFSATGSFLAENTANATCFEKWKATLNQSIGSFSGQLNGDWNTRKNDLQYFISIDDGATWTQVTHWDSVTKNTDGTKTKKARIDTLSLGLVGNRLKWKAVFQNNDDHCQAPEIDSVNISYEASGNNTFSRGSPIVLGNVLYSGSLETPASSWLDKTRLHGHFRAYRIYDPANPAQASYQDLWDSGQKLADRNLTTNPRTLYVAMPTPQQVSDVVIGVGNGRTLGPYSGTFSQGRILAGSLTITDGTETFIDSGLNSLVDSTGRTVGAVNRFSGAYSFTFLTAPGVGVQIRASYEYYPAPTGGALSQLADFNRDYVTNDMLGINSEYVAGAGYTYDFNKDGQFSDLDRIYLINWVKGFNGTDTTTEREWPLDAIDHSTPAVVGPPGLPAWYYGSDITQEERTAYDAWAKENENRRTVAYVGSRSGMLHAFDAGAYRNGDNPATSFVENRGYFANKTDEDVPDYGTGDELWAFIPNNCLPRLKYQVKPTLPLSDPPYVDASPAVEDIYYTDASGTHFKTVLLSAEGNGGDTIFALDVTDPTHPMFMWEYANPNLWRSKSSPPIGKIVRIADGGQPKWVVFFVSGQTAANQHPSIFMVDVLTGSLLKLIELDGPGNDNLGAVLSGSPAILDANGNGYVDRLYVTDDKGFVYRVNIPDSPQSVLDIDSITDCELVQVPSSIYASPTVYPMNTYDQSGNINAYNIKVMFGTGDNPNFNDNPNSAGTTYMFYVFDDQCGPLNNAGNMLDNAGMTCNCAPMQQPSNAAWSFTLPAGNRIWTAAVAAAGTVYFGTSTTDTEDPCAASTTGLKGSIYAVDLAHLPSSDLSPLAANVGNVMNLTVEDQHLYAKVTNPDTGTNIVSYGGAYNNKVAIGNQFGTFKVPSSWRQVIPQ